jgi:hypothetical protein
LNGQGHFSHCEFVGINNINRAVQGAIT